MAHSKLILVGITYSLDLTDRILPRLRICEAFYPAELTFSAYSAKEILDILNSTEADETTSYLVSMPTKFRKNVWIKRGDFCIVKPIEEGDKDHIRLKILAVVADAEYEIAYQVDEFFDFD